MTLKEYAQQENITIGAAYLRVWNRKVDARRIDGKWFVFPKEESQLSTAEGASPEKELAVLSA